jgi:hypothetical protein
MTGVLRGRRAGSDLVESDVSSDLLEVTSDLAVVDDGLSLISPPETPPMSLGLPVSAAPLAPRGEAEAARFDEPRHTEWASWLASWPRTGRFNFVAILIVLVIVVGAAYGLSGGNRPTSDLGFKKTLQGWSFQQQKETGGHDLASHKLVRRRLAWRSGVRATKSTTPALPRSLPTDASPERTSARRRCTSRWAPSLSHRMSSFWLPRRPLTRRR